MNEPEEVSKGITDQISGSLSSVTTDDLWAELSSRFTASVLVTMESGGEDADICQTWQIGNAWTCRGILDYALDDMKISQRVGEDG